MNQRQIFLQHIAQTSPAPLAIEIVKASGCIMWDAAGKEYLDVISGISVCNIGHCHPEVVAAVKEQAEKYMHLLVYGELVESPQVTYAKLITDHLPESLNCVYFTNSGAEATEGAMKLAKRVTGRTEILAFNYSYHGSTQGALSIMGDEYWRNAFRPLLPGISHVNFNEESSLDSITEHTACVIAETFQAERGVFLPSGSWMKAMRRRCTETGTLLVLDEIQAGFGRTGTLWGFEQFGIIPDILLLGKALGAGMPLGAFIANREVMNLFTENPVLGHITTFGGHPVCCAAGLAGMKALLNQQLIADVVRKAELFENLLVHPVIKKVRSAGLLMAVEFEHPQTAKKVIDQCIADGVLTDWFLFAPQCMRLAPPLVISDDQIRQACRVILNACDRSG